MYGSFGGASVTSLLAFLSVGICGIPFIFVGKAIGLRKAQSFCRFWREKDTTSEVVEGKV